MEGDALETDCSPRNGSVRTLSTCTCAALQVLAVALLVGLSIAAAMSYETLHKPCVLAGGGGPGGGRELEGQTSFLNQRFAVASELIGEGIAVMIVTGVKFRCFPFWDKRYLL